MSSIEWPDPLLTLADWERLPEDERFTVEVVKGVMALSPRALPIHQNAVVEFTYTLKRQLPQELWPIADLEVLIQDRPLTIGIPDVAVAPSDTVAARSPRVDAAKVLLAVEVASDRTRRVDRVTKFAEYAEAGIPQYWLIDLDQPVTLTAFQLVGDTYELDGEFVGNVRLRVDGHPVVLDLDQLTAR